MDLVSIRALMQHIISLFLSLLVGWSVGASADSSIEEPLAPFAKMTKLSSDFQQTRVVKEWQAEINTQGKMSVINGEAPQVIWEIHKPTYSGVKLKQNQLLVRNDQTTPWIKLENQKIKKTMSQIFTWLRFDLAQIKKDFVIEKVSQGFFKFTPRNEKSHFEKIEISFRKAPLLDKIELFEKNQDKITILFSNTKVE